MNEIKNIIIGYEFGEKKSQICYYDRKEQDAVSMPVKVGSNMYEFPNLLSKKQGLDEWQYGIEAQYFAAQIGYVSFDDLYNACHSEDMVALDSQMIEPWRLMGIFLKCSLTLLGVNDLVLNTRGIMITTRHLSREMVQNLRRACEFVGFTKNQYFIQDYDESFYYHTFYQQPEVWARKSALFYFHERKVTYQDLSHNPNSKPATVTLSRGDTVDLSIVPREKDMQFYQLIEKSFKNYNYSSVFLVGEEFDQSWASRSVALLCANQRRVFHGNNLFAKGACYAVKEKLEDHILKNFQYEGSDLVRTNIGMEMTISGTPAYYSLIMAGMNWYESSKECELILDGTEELIFFVHNAGESEKVRYCMELPGLPKRPNKTTRIHLSLEYESIHTLKITARDLGFGEMFPSSGMVWTETLNLIINKATAAGAEFE